MPSYKTKDPSRGLRQSNIDSNFKSIFFKLQNKRPVKGIETKGYFAIIFLLLLQNKRPVKGIETPAELLLLPQHQSYKTKDPSRGLRHFYKFSNSSNI